MRSRVCLLCLGVIRDDPRVRKQGDLLHEAGFDVVGLGFIGGGADYRGWPIVGPKLAVGAATWSRRFEQISKRPQLYAPYLLARAAQPFAGLSDRLALAVYWSRPAFRLLHAEGADLACDIYVANDWNMLPLAHRLARTHGGRVVYDSHEYAADELPESLRWRLFDRPLATAIERMFIPGCAFVSTVSGSIADALQRDHRLVERPLVVRNVPPRSPATLMAPDRSAGNMSILYHGGITQPRRIDVLVESVPLWSAGRRLDLRGPISPAYRATLQSIMDRHGLADRVKIHNPVPADRLIASAASSDIGIVCLPATSRENQYALPNKVFEYVGAGLGLLVPSLDELQRLVRHYDNGIDFGDLTPPAIAAAVNRLDWPQIARFKERSRAAARELVWDIEAAPWVEALRRTAETQAAR